MSEKMPRRALSLFLAAFMLLASAAAAEEPKLDRPGTLPSWAPPEGGADAAEAPGYYMLSPFDLILIAEDCRGTMLLFGEDETWRFAPFAWRAGDACLTLAFDGGRMKQAWIAEGDLYIASGEGADRYARDDTAALQAINDRQGIARAQQLLNEAGYACGSADGIVGKKTRAALRDYQRDSGLTVSGDVTVETLLMLRLGLRLTGGE